MSDFLSVFLSCNVCVPGLFGGFMEVIGPLKRIKEAVRDKLQKKFICP